MADRLILSVMGLIFGIATFAALGLTTFLVITEVQQRVANFPPPPPTSYAQNTSASAVR